LCIFPREKLWTLYSEYPSLAFDLTWLAAREEQMLDEHLLSAGRPMRWSVLPLSCSISTHARRRSASQRTTSFSFPLRSSISPMRLVHPTLRRLVNCKLVRWKDRAFEILDRDELAKSAIFDVRNKHPRPFI
jgi:CRP/FNR family transcriptional regulator, anaerobic regulatory protein